MCGICGIIKKNSDVSLEDIDRMLMVQSHRGPDEEGRLIEKNVGIGHCRLSIIALSDGKQPMFNSDKSICISFNGEIYNYKELKCDLEKDGFIFHTDSDTEVIIYAYEKFGTDCLSRLRGMFSFCILDFIKKEAFCARDCLGIKPFVYYLDEKQFAFSSEISALKTITGFDNSIDYKAIDDYLFLQYIPAPNSIYKRVKKLKPGHYIKVRFDLSISEQIQWWDFSFKPSIISRNEDEWTSFIDSALRDSVEQHLVSDVQYGAFLSGGIDSTLVVNYMSKILSEPVETFSVGFEQDDNSELEYAERAAKTLGTNHHSQVINGDAFKILPELVSHYGEPFGDSSAIPTYYVSKLASDYVKMVLSGDGGDEIFCGYDRYKGWNDFCLRRVFPFSKNNSSLQNYYPFIQYLGNDLRHTLWKKKYKNTSCRPVDFFEEEYKRTKRFHHLQKAQYIDLKTYLPFDCLTKVDIASMCHSLEVRTPFVDQKVLQTASFLPIETNFTYSAKYGFQGKNLLKKILMRKFNEDFVYRHKRGFSIPLGTWLKNKNNLAYKLKKNLLSKETKIKDLFEMSVIRQIVESNNQYHIYVLIFLEEWLQQNAS